MANDCDTKFRYLGGHTHRRKVEAKQRGELRYIH